MKTTAAAFIFLVASVACNAQQSPSTREDTLRKLENAFNATTVLTPDSPFLIGLIQSAKSANPGVLESTWQSLRQEFSNSVNAALQNDGGATLRWLRVAFAPLSDSELEHIAQLYSDPVFVKAQGSMASTAAQQETVRRMFVQSQLMSAGVNAVLKKHGMQEVH